MIVECRPSSHRKCIVIWESSETVKTLRGSFKQKVLKEKSFDTFADANGFMMGMMKRGMVASLIYE